MRLPCLFKSRLTSLSLTAVLALSLAALTSGCPAKSGDAARSSGLKIGLVTDVGGRGDKSFNDSALRGLENWAADVEYTSGGYKPLTPEARAATLDEELSDKGISPLGISPVVLHAKQQEDYESNLQLLIDDGVSLAIGVGFMLENAVESAAAKNPEAKFLLVDSPILNADGTPHEMPNVATVTFREQEGAFLVGAIAGLSVSDAGKVGFVGGMQLPLIRRFEVGFRAGVKAVAPDKAEKMLSAYTGSFNRVDSGKQVAQDMFAKGAEVIFHAAGADGLGVIAAAKEAGKMAIGCDSDQFEAAPEAVLTSLIKRVDVAVYQAVAAAKSGEFKPGNREIGLKEGGLSFAPLKTARLSSEKKADVLSKVNALKELVVSGKVRVPATLEELESFTFRADFAEKPAAQTAAPADKPAETETKDAAKAPEADKAPEAK